MTLLGDGKNKNQVRGFPGSTSGVGWNGSHSLLRGHVHSWPVWEGNGLGPRDTWGVEVEMTPPPRKSQSCFSIPAWGPGGGGGSSRLDPPGKARPVPIFSHRIYLWLWKRGPRLCGCSRLSWGLEHPLWGWDLGAARLPPSGPLLSPGPAASPDPRTQRAISV